MSIQANVADQATADALVSQYEEAYDEYLDALELEDKLQAGMRVGDLAERLQSLGLRSRMDQIQAECREWS